MDVVTRQVVDNSFVSGVTLKLLPSQEDFEFQVHNSCDYLTSVLYETMEGLCWIMHHLFSLTTFRYEKSYFT